MAEIGNTKRAKAREVRRKQLGLFDENPPGVDPLWHYFALFRLLQLSQSYWLAHQHVSGLRPQTERPAEFDKVLHTYGLFGPVWEVPFWEWWRDQARMHFGSDELVRVLESNEEAAGKSRDATLDPSVTRLTLSVPLIGTRTSILKQVENILRQHQSAWSPAPPPAGYRVIKDKTRKDTMNAAIRAAQARAQLSGPLYAIGERSSLAPKEWDEVDPTALSELTSRHIRRAFLWAENAARGRFPSNDKPAQEGDWPKLDFLGLKDRLGSYVRVSEAALAEIPANERTSEHRYAGRNRTISW